MTADKIQPNAPSRPDINRQMVGEGSESHGTESAKQTQSKARLQEKLARVRDRLRGIKREAG